MGFFDDFGKKISSAGQEAIAKTKELADVAKINSNISDEENKIKTAYSEIGKKYFENHSEDSEEDYEAQLLKRQWRRSRLMNSRSLKLRV
mgnify:CR=1 FL=1